LIKNLKKKLCSSYFNVVVYDHNYGLQFFCKNSIKKRVVYPQEDFKKYVKDLKKVQNGTRRFDLKSSLTTNQSIRMKIFPKKV
jgi:hypothetical protein